METAVLKPMIAVSTKTARISGRTAWADDSLDQKLVRATPGGNMTVIKSLISEGANVDAKGAGCNQEPQGCGRPVDCEGRRGYGAVIPLCDSSPGLVLEELREF